MSDLEERFSIALHGTARAWRQAVDRRLKHLGVSQASWMTIAVAAQATRPLSQSALADRLSVEGATLVAMVDRLVKSGFVERAPSTTDRRVKRVVVTAAGHRLYTTVKAEVARVRRELLAAIDAADLGVATAVLEALLDVLENPARVPPGRARSRGSLAS